ncbi:MAG: DUF885 family protein [Anaerolineales bacterium]|nr:DUF885 family protein [Anaerolineales bacterium]
MSDDQNTSMELHELFDEAWEFQMRDDPLYATMCGDHRFNDQLPSVSEADYERRLERMREFLNRAKVINKDSLSDEDRLNHDIFTRTMDSEIAEVEFRSYRMPVAKVEGFHSRFADLPQLVPLNTLDDYENYIARLRAFETYVDGQIEVMSKGMEDGHVPPDVVLDGVDDSITPHVVDDATESVFYEPFQNFPKVFGTADQKRFLDEGSAAIMDSIVPAYQKLLKFILDDYTPAAREDVSAASLPNGHAFYDHRVRRYTTLDVSARQVHETGFAEVKRIRSEMEAIIDDVGFQGEFKDFIEFLRTDPQFYVDEPDGLLKEVSMILKKMDGELPRLFKTLPRMPYGIKEVPEHIAPRTTTGYYLPPAGDGTRAGYYYVNTYDLKSRPLYEIEALSLHEAVPGHHLQIALQQEITEMPNFRRFGWVTAFGEGWALYAERLGLETGFYQDPYSNFGRLTYEMWRACRLVVDPGMHELDWSRQQAIDFLVENTALTLLNIENEVDRYIAWPGQAISYKMGELKIRELRTYAEEELGPDFDLRQFHEVILRHGGIPLAVLEEFVRSWVEEEKKGR